MTKLTTQEIVEGLREIKKQYCYNVGHTSSYNNWLSKTNEILDSAISALEDKEEFDFIKECGNNQKKN